MTNDEQGTAQGPSAIVQRADCASHVVVLEVRVPGQTSLVVVGVPRSAPTRAAAGLLTRDARNEIWGARLPPASTRERSREDALAHARVLAIGATDVLVDQRGDLRVVRAQGGRVVVTDATPAERADFIAATEEQRATWQNRGYELARALAADALEVHRTDVARALERALGKIDRRRDAIRGDLAKIAKADTLASQAQWLVGEAAKAKRGATKLVVTDWSSGEPVAMEVPLDPAKSAKEQVEAMFKRAKRLRLGGRIAEDRLAQAETQWLTVATSLDAVRAAADVIAIDEAAREAKRAAPRDVVLPQSAGSPDAGTRGTRGSASSKTRRVAFRTFVARSGRKLLVGKGAADNDELTLHVAKPHDLWLHAKDRTGAHVIVPLEKGQTCPAEDLVDAAHLAAHFSDARDEKAVDVQYTPKRFLRKPKGSAVGFVVVDREKVLPLRFDAALLAALLEREEI